MAKRQKRKSTSVNLRLYEEMQRQCDKRGEAVSAYVERLVLADMGATIDTIPGMRELRYASPPIANAQKMGPAPAVIKNQCRDPKCLIRGLHAHVGNSVLR